METSKNRASLLFLLGQPVLLPVRLCESYQLRAGERGAAQPLLAALGPGLGGRGSPHRSGHTLVREPPGLRLALHRRERDAAAPCVAGVGPVMCARL